MMELRGKRGFEGGLSYPQITLPHLGDKHHEDQATIALNYEAQYMKFDPLP
jgi:hypothetical protein